MKAAKFGVQRPRRRFGFFGFLKACQSKAASRYACRHAPNPFFSDLLIVCILLVTSPINSARATTIVVARTTSEIVFVRSFRALQYNPGQISVAVIPDDCLADCKGQVAIRFLGESEAIDGLPEEMPDSWKAGLSDGVRGLIETEIAARGEYVGSPIDIVRISPNGAQWIQRKTECAELQPQGKSQQPSTFS